MFLEGKKGLIIGLANKHSIAYGIAKALKDQGAELGFTYLNDSLLKRVQPIAEDFGSDIVIPLDVTKEEDMENLKDRVEEKMGNIDFVVHSIAFAPKRALAGETLDTEKNDFLVAMDVSVYSLIGVTQKLLPVLNPEASILTLSYYGAEKFVPRYNIMGIAKAALEATVRYLAVDLGSRNIRINALSAGPIKTLAASGIDDFRNLMNWNRDHSPLGRNVTIDDVGSSAMYLLSPLSRGVTGELHYVDSGYNIIGMPLHATDKDEK
jgi:enoyl-[acyl-carrier protein] reductase I